MTLSRGQIRKRLGQQLKVGYSYWHSKNIWPEYGDRRDGATTDMIIDVMEWLQDGPERPGYVVGYTAAYTEQLLFLAKDCADQLGFDHRMLGGMARAKYERCPGAYRRNKFFFDHYDPRLERSLLRRPDH